MRVRPLGLLVLAIAGAPACGKSQVNEPQIAWLAHTDAACRAADEQHKSLLFFLTASWDVAAKELERTVFIDPEVRRIVRKSLQAVREQVRDGARDGARLHDGALSLRLHVRPAAIRGGAPEHSRARSLISGGLAPERETRAAGARVAFSGHHCICLFQ